MTGTVTVEAPKTALNESPSEKEGKYRRPARQSPSLRPSMKVPPKRKGNAIIAAYGESSLETLNESPSEKEGKSAEVTFDRDGVQPLNESPSEKEGKSV